MLNEFIETLYASDQRKSAELKLASTMENLPAEVLHRIISGEEKLACAYETSSGGSSPTWLDRFKGTPLFQKALEVEQQDLQLRMAEQRNRASERQERDQRWAEVDALRDEIGVHRKLLELELAAHSEGVVPGAGGEEEELPEQGAVRNARPEDLPENKEAPPPKPRVQVQVESPQEKEATERLQGALLKVAFGLRDAAGLAAVGGGLGLAGGGLDALQRRNNPEAFAERSAALGPLGRASISSPLTRTAFGAALLPATFGGMAAGGHLGGKFGPGAWGVGNAVGSVLGAVAPVAAFSVADRLLKRREQNAAAPAQGATEADMAELQALEQQEAAAGGDPSKLPPGHPVNEDAEFKALKAKLGSLRKNAFGAALAKGMLGAAKSAVPGVGKSLAQAGSQTAGAFQRGGLGSGLRTAGRSALAFGAKHPVAAGSALAAGGGFLAGRASD